MAASAMPRTPGDPLIPYPYIRQLTGLPNQWRSYAYDPRTNTPIISCLHRHRSRKMKGQWVSGSVFAEKCAEKLVRKAKRIVAATVTATDEQRTA